MKKLNQIIDFSISVLSGIAALALAFLLLGISYSTFSRFAFNRPLSNLVEYSTYSLIYITFLGAPQILKNKGHINIDIITNYLSANAKIILSMATNSVGTIVSTIILYYSFLVVKDNVVYNVKVMDSMGTPQYLLTIVIPIGMFFLTIQFIRNLLDDYQEIKEKHK